MYASSYDITSTSSFSWLRTLAWQEPTSSNMSLLDLFNRDLIPWVWIQYEHDLDVIKWWLFWPWSRWQWRCHLRVAVPVNSCSVDQVFLPPLAYAQVEAPLSVIVVVAAVVVVVVVVLKASTWPSRHCLQSLLKPRLCRPATWRRRHLVWWRWRLPGVRLELVIVILLRLLPDLLVDVFLALLLLLLLLLSAAAVLHGGAHSDEEGRRNAVTERFRCQFHLTDYIARWEIVKSIVKQLSKKLESTVVASLQKFMWKWGWRNQVTSHISSLLEKMSDLNKASLCHSDELWLVC